MALRRVDQMRSKIHINYSILQQIKNIYFNYLWYNVSYDRKKDLDIKIIFSEYQELPTVSSV